VTLARPENRYAEGVLVAGSGITLEPRGTHTLKGIAEPCELYPVVDVTS